MTRINFDFTEKALIYAFGCTDKKRTVANVNGTVSIGNAWTIDHTIAALNIANLLLDPTVRQEEYLDIYKLAKKDVEEEMFRQVDIYRAEHKGSPVKKDFWKTFLKASIICIYGDTDIQDAIYNVRMLQCYAVQPKMVKVLEEVLYTLDDILNNDEWKYEYYLNQYKEIALVGNAIYEVDYHKFIAYMMEVEDVELE